MVRRRPFRRAALILGLGAAIAGCAGPVRPQSTSTARQEISVALGQISSAKFSDALAAAAGQTKMSCGLMTSPDYAGRASPKPQSGDLLKKALEDAQRKAQILAAAGHLKLGSIDAIVQEVAGITPITTALKGNVPLSSGAINVSPNAPVALVVRYKLLGGSGTLEVVGFSSPPTSPNYQLPDRSRTSIVLNASGRTLSDAVQSLKSCENVVRKTAQELGVSENAVEVRATNLDAPQQR
jgi:hypothetical protein